MNLVDIVEQDQLSKTPREYPKFRAGDTVAVHVRITEGNKTRIQVFQGVCIGVRRNGRLNGHFKVRKISSGMGVERVFPFHSPSVEKVEVVSFGKVRQSKLYYLRDRSGKAARVATDYDRKA